MTNRASYLIDKLQLNKHPEGGYYKEVFRSPNTVFSSVVSEDRSAITDIYFLLVKKEVSKFHCVKHDEIWHFYEGAPLQIHDINKKTNNYNAHILGDNDSKNKIGYKAHIPGGHWQAAETLGEYTLVGCTVGAGFDFKDFQLLEKSAISSNPLFKTYPELNLFITCSQNE
jgi:predicted cupin superfamily sugar epimerase